MTDPLDAYGDALRRALHAEADAVVPAPDGLDLIRARISERRRRRFGWAWFTETWGRPAMALAAAAFIAIIAIAATPAFHAIEGITAGDRGSANGDEPGRSVGNGTSVPGHGGSPGQPYPGAPASPAPTSSPTPLSSPTVGAPTCRPSAGARSTASSSPSTPESCTSPPPPVSSPPDTVNTPTTEPPTSDTPSVTSEPPAPEQQQVEQQAQQ
jgi:hypothetical protein